MNFRTFWVCDFVVSLLLNKLLSKYWQFSYFVWFVCCSNEWFELFFSVYFVFQQKELHFWIELFGFNGNLSLEPVYKIFNRVLEQYCFLRKLCALWDFYHIVIPGCSSQVASQHFLEVLSHTKKLNTIGSEIYSILFHWWTGHV